MKNCIERWYILASAISPCRPCLHFSGPAACQRASGSLPQGEQPVGTVSVSPLLELPCHQSCAEARERCRGLYVPMHWASRESSLVAKPKALPSCPVPGREARLWPSSINCILVGEAEHGARFRWVNPGSSGSLWGFMEPCPGRGQQLPAPLYPPHREPPLLKAADLQAVPGQSSWEMRGEAPPPPC